MEEKQKNGIEIVNEILGLMSIRIDNLDDFENMIVYDLKKENIPLESCGNLNRNETCKIFDYDKCNLLEKSRMYLNYSYSFTAFKLLDSLFAFEKKKYPNSRYKEIYISFNKNENNENALFDDNEIQFKIIDEYGDGTSIEVEIVFFAFVDDNLYRFIFETNLTDETKEIDLYIGLYNDDNNHDLQYPQYRERSFKLKECERLNISHGAWKTKISHNRLEKDTKEQEEIIYINALECNSDFYMQHIIEFFKNNEELYINPLVKEKIVFLLPIFNLFVNELFKGYQGALLEREYQDEQNALKNLKDKIAKKNAYLNKITKKINDEINELLDTAEKIKQNMQEIDTLQEKKYIKH